jgi:hypothetical protein
MPGGAHAMVAEVICSVASCGRLVLARGLCGMHYQRLWKRGTTDAAPIASLAERFERSVEKTLDCWLWLGTRDARGYGIISVRCRYRRATHVSYELHVGAVPADGLFVLHRCDNPPCVRPDHLFLGTALDNMRDCIAKGRRRTKAVTGEAHGAAKLTAASVRLMREMHANGAKQVDLAHRFNINFRTVSLIVQRKLWRQE